MTYVNNWCFKNYKRKCSLEVIFLLDSSESAKTDLFQQEKMFVLRFSTRLSMLQIKGISLNIRMAALQYSSSVSIEHRFVDWVDLDSFQGKINTMSYIGQGTFTTFAITNATQMILQETKTEAVRIAVLMTDGVDHPRNPNVITAATEAKRNGIKFFTIGLSDVALQRESREKLQAIASPPPERFFHLLDDRLLVEKLMSISMHSIVGWALPCRNHCAVECIQNPLELIFVIDSSESVGPKNFELIKDFVNTLVDRTTVRWNATRVGVVLYSNINVVVVNLKQEATADEVKDFVRNMEYLGQGTYTGSGIEKANLEFEAARPGVRKVAIIITDGQTDQRDSVSLESAVTKAKANKVEMFVIGVVNESDPNLEKFKEELNFIASDPDEEHMFLIKDFDTLNGILLPGTPERTGNNGKLPFWEEGDDLTFPEDFKRVQIVVRIKSFL
uniref:VWFA domain-containing protein n=1 Tax=Fundulus heteroclitus TaxID=8078 RepID=A0A3Q2QHD3_FUNHE